MSLVKLEHLKKVYSMGDVQVEALRDVSLEIGKGSFVSIIGPSGSGKTTLLNIIGCLDKTTTGVVEVAGHDLNSLNRRRAAEFRGEYIGFVFQSFNLMPVLTIAENVEYPLIMVKKFPKDERKRLVAEVLEAVGIADQADKYPDSLSGGQKQRVAVARALAAKPQLVLADEPTANLDQASAQMVIGLMKKLRDDLGATFIFSTHDVRIIDQVDTIYRLEDGRLTDYAGKEEHSHV